MKHTAASYLDFVRKKPGDHVYPQHKPSKSTVPGSVLKNSTIRVRHPPAVTPVPPKPQIYYVPNHPSVKSSLVPRSLSP